MASLITFEGMPIELLTEAAIQAFKDLTTALDGTLEKASRFGRILSEVRNTIPHGEWCEWVQDTFGDTVSLRKIQRYMQIANASDQTLLEGAKTIDEALDRIAEPKSKTVGVTVVDPIEASSTPVKEPSEPKQSANPRSSAAQSSPKPAPEFDLGSSLDEHRSAILDMAGDYAAAKQTKHFIVMLRKVAADLEATTPGGAN